MTDAAIGPEISVGLPVAGNNVGQFEAAVRSVFAQTFGDWELVILLDGVSDQLSERAHQIDDSRIVILTHTVSGGLAKGLNEITTTARSPLLARLDGDDIMAPTRLERQTAYLRAHPEVDVLASRAITIDDRTVIRGILPEDPIPTNQAGFLKSHCSSHPTVMRRTEWSKNHPYDPRYLRGEDKELWFRSQPTTTYAKLNEPLMFYRVGRNPNPTKQRLSAEYDRMLLREVGPQFVGRFGTLRRVADSMTRQLIYSVAVAIGQGSLLYSRHHEPLAEETHAAVTEALALASSAKVPGWDR
ncbi:MAG: glycosyltransferase [Bifidobacterium crudilactis]|nr:glycosyltransferase [Bifidobacterium crudilactis]